MLVKVTKKMVNELNKAVRRSGRDYEFKYRECSVDFYTVNVNYDYLTAYDYGDFDFNKNMFRYIRVVYPLDCYAIPGTLTTEELNKIFNSLPDKTAEAFFAEVLRACDI